MNRIKQTILKENSFKTLFENSTIPQLIIEGNHFIECNTQAALMLGFKNRSDVIGLKPEDISIEYQPDGIRSSIKAKQLLESARKEGTKSDEWVHKKLNEESLFTIVDITPIRINERQVEHITLIDTTRLVMTDRAMHESEFKFKSIFEGSQDAIILLDNERFTDCNTRTLTIFGYNNKEEFLRLTPKDISPREQSGGEPTREVIKRHINNAYSNGVDRFKWKHLRSNGEEFPCEIVLSSLNLRGKNMLLATIRDITERERIETSLKESEERYRILSDVTMEGILIHENGMARDVNLAYCTMFGYRKEELIGRDVIDLLITESDKSICRDIVSNRSQETYEVDAYKKNGTLIRLEVMGKPFLHDNKILRVTAVRDITEKKIKDEILRQSEKRFRTIFESANEAILIHNPNTGEIINANKRALLMYGYKNIKELNNRNLWIDKPFSLEDAIKLMKKTILHGPQNFEWRLKKGDGTILWLEVNLDRINIDRQDLVVAMCHDITERKAIEEKLKEGEEKYRRITESSLDVFITLKNDRSILFVSPSITRYTGYKPGELTGQSLDILIPVRESGRMREIFAKAKAGEETGLFEVSLYRKDRGIAVMEISIVPTLSRNRTREFELYARDITDRKNLEMEIIKISEEERQRFSRDLHDGLGQTLTGISIMIGTLARKVELKKELTQEEILAIAGRVEEAIETARQTAQGLYPVTLEKGGLLPALRDMAGMIKGNYGINCAVQYHGGSDEVDNYTSNQVYYIALEAVNNAIKHSHAEKITIDLTIDTNILQMTIENDGAPKKKKGKGPGLGMRHMQYRAHLINARIHSETLTPGYRVELVTALQ